MKLKGRQVEFTAQDVQALLTMAGLTPAVVGQIVGFVQDRQLELVEVDNSEDNGLVSIAEPAAGTVYRVLYPTTAVSIGETSPGDTFWIEFLCGYVNYDRGLPFTFTATEVVYWATTDTSQGELVTGKHYQIQVRNVFGRVYATMVNTELLAPTVAEEEEEQ